MTDFSKPEPPPEMTELPSVHDLVIKDIADRKTFGFKKYGVHLTAENGRDCRVDLYQELLDAVCYMRVWLQSDDARDNVIDALTVELKRSDAKVASLELDLMTLEGKLSEMTNRARVAARISSERADLADELRRHISAQIKWHQAEMDARRDAERLVESHQARINELEDYAAECPGEPFTDIERHLSAVSDTVAAESAPCRWGFGLSRCKPPMVGRRSVEVKPLPRSK